jgi:hypothetical protein
MAKPPSIQDLERFNQLGRDLLKIPKNIRKLSRFDASSSPTPPAVDPFYIAPGVTPVVLNITSGSIQQVQQQIDNARAASPDSFIVINLSGTYEVVSTPLTLRSKQILYFSGTLKKRYADDNASSLIHIPSGQSVVGVMGRGSVSRLIGTGVDYGIKVDASSSIIIDNLTLSDHNISSINVQGLGTEVFSSHISITRCTISYGSSTSTGAGDIVLYDANQSIIADNTFTNIQSKAISLSANNSTVYDNNISDNKQAGVIGINLNGENNTIYNNIIDDISTGIKINSSSPISHQNKIIDNDIKNSNTAIGLSGTNNLVYNNEYTSNTLNILQQSVSNNFVIASTIPLSGNNNTYFYPPTKRNPHSTTLIVNGKGRTNLSISNTTVSDIQTQYNTAVANNPNDVIVLTLGGSLTVGASPLLLSSYSCILFEDNATLTSTSTDSLYAISAHNESFISVSGGTLNGSLLSAGAISLTNCSTCVIDAVSAINSGDKNVRGTSDLINLKEYIAGPKIVRGCKVDQSNSRGIWLRSTFLDVVIDNEVTNCNLDAIDLDAFSGKCLVANNICNNNIRDGIFIEEGAQKNVLLKNTLTYNNIGINVYSFSAGPTRYNSIIDNIANYNVRGLRAGNTETQTTEANYFYNNTVQNNTLYGILATTVDYYSDNIITDNADNSFNESVIFFNPRK